MLHFLFRQCNMQGLRTGNCRGKHRFVRKGFDSSADAAHSDRSDRFNTISKLRKLTVFFTVLLIFGFAGCFICFAEDADYEYGTLYNNSGADGLNDSLSDEARSILSEFSIDASDPDSLAEINGFDILKKLIELSLKDIKSPISVLVSVSAMAVIFALVFQSSPDPIGAKQGAFSYILPAACAVAVAASLADVISKTAQSVSSCSVFMMSFIPAYAGLLISCGKSATGGAYSSLMFAVSQVFCSVADKLMIPLCSCMMVSSIGAAFADICKRAADIIKKVSVTVLTFGMTVFTFMLGLQTSISSASDTLGIKTAKTAMGTFIPIVGSSLGESLSVILGSVSLLKCSVGVYSVICLAVMFVPTLTELIVWKAVLCILAAVMQAVGAEKTEKLLSLSSGVLTVLMCILLCCAASYIISVALTLSAGGG